MKYINKRDGEAGRKIEALVQKLQQEIARGSDNLNLKRERLHVDEIEERKFELKRRRLDENMDQKSKSSAKKRLLKR